MSFLRGCLNHLDSFGVRYTHTVDPLACTAEEIPAGENMPGHLVAKAVVCESDDRYLLVVVPAGWYVDIGRVGLAIGAKKFCMATESEIAVLFPFSEVDAVPPLGGLAGLPVYLDRQLANQEFIAFNAGSHHDLIHMRTADFMQIAQTIIGPFGCCDFQKEFRKRFLASRKAAGA
jgi:Ala-tRNA(Pro) deacylase